MAIKVNAATSETTTAKLYTGVAAWRVTGINPTQEQLKAMGFKAEKEPVYTQVDENGVRNTRLVLFVEATAPGGVKIHSNMAFFIKNKIRDSIFINRLGKFSSDRSKVSGEVRNPYDGEIELLNFIADWCNIKMKKGEEEELYLESIKTLAETGDIYEIRQIFQAAKDNLFKALAIVSEGKYQRVFTRQTARIWSNDYSRIHKSLADNASYIKEDLGGIDLKVYIDKQFVLKPWKGVTQDVAAGALAGAATNGNGHHSPADNGSAPPPSSSGDDEAPF